MSSTEPCDDDGLESDGKPRQDEPTEPDIAKADFDYEAPGFEPLPEDEPEEG